MTTQVLERQNRISLKRGECLSLDTLSADDYTVLEFDGEATELAIITSGLRELRVSALRRNFGTEEVQYEVKGDFTFSTLHPTVVRYHPPKSEMHEEIFRPLFNKYEITV